MFYDGFQYKFLGARRQEEHSHDLIPDDCFDIPCGKCDLCRVTRRYERALRIMLEAEFWPYGCSFITLTFSDDHVGTNELVHDEWSQFMKNFRQKFGQVQHCNIRDRGTIRHGKVYSRTWKPIKQVMCGEYGDSFGRKHFHGIIFNHTFDDLVFTGNYGKHGHPIYTSESLSSVWKKGIVQVAVMSFDLALYVGKYVTNPMDEEPDKSKKREYGRFGAGIGKSWLKLWWRDVLSASGVMLRTDSGTQTYPIPRAFLKWMEEDICPEQFASWKKEKRDKFLSRREELIAKDDGPLRRAQAKGRIFKQINKRMKYVRQKER